MRDMGEEMEELRDLLKDSQRGSRDEAIRNRYRNPNPDPNSNPNPNPNPNLTLTLTLPLPLPLPLTRYHGTKEDLLAEKYLDRARKQAEPTPP